MTVNTREYQYIFSLNTQADIETAITLTSLDKQRSLRTFAPIVQEQPAVITDRNWFGKGDSHPSFRDVLQKQFVINAQERSATNLEALYAAAFVMGEDAASQPDTANPNEWEHIITWQDPRANKLVRFTSVGEEMGTEYKKLLSGAWLSSFTMTGNREDHVTLSFEGGGRKYATSTFVIPGLTAASFFKTLFGTVNLGLAAAPSISAQVLSWNLTVSQNPQPLWLMGNPAGEEDLITEVLVGDQTVSGEVVVKVSSAFRDHFLNDDLLEVIITCFSPDVIDVNKHKMEIKIPNVRVSGEAFSEEGQTVAYTLTFDEESVLKGSAVEQLVITFLTDIDNLALLVNA